ncbi:MAG: WYL domain-containing protein [Victivallales bacterium]
MPTNKKQLQRLVKFVAMLKENRYPNCYSFVEELRKDDLYGNKNVICTTKTIQRDILTLKNDFDAPIEYDPERKGYYLKSHGWDFPCPLFEEHEMLASILGARVAEEIFPEPLRSSIRKAVDFQLTTNNPDFLDTAYPRALIISSGLKVRIDRDVFNTVFEGWKTHHAIDIVYKDVSDRGSERRVDPQVLAFQDSAWFIKGYCHKNKAVRTFAIHRIESAELTDKTFEPDEKIIKSVREVGPYTYPEIRNVKLICSKSIKKYLVEKPLHKDQSIEDETDKEFTLLVPAIWETDLIHFILYQGGDAKLVHPKGVAARIVKAAERILELHKQ